jgi:dTDP-4-amino-4,6-dideoxygalactose transaminase
MTYLPADPLLTYQALFGALRPVCGGRWSNLPAQTHYFESGRVALWAALRALRLGAGDQLVVPAYVCDSILPAPAALGIGVGYVGVDWTLRLDLSAVEQALSAGARAVMVVHYFGFPAPDFDELAALCARYGAALIEDCAQALFSRVGTVPLGSRGQAAIFSPWKSVPLTDGGALVLNGPTLPVDLAGLPGPTALTTARRLAYRVVPTLETRCGFSPRLWLLRSWLLRRRLQDRVAQRPLQARRGSRLSFTLLGGTDWWSVVHARREHYINLLDALRGVTWARPLIDQLPSGVCPLGLPILAADRELARRRLLAAGVNVRTYWEQLPNAVTSDAFPVAHELARRILVLPVHQSLTPLQIQYLIRTLTVFEGLPWPSAS